MGELNCSGKTAKFILALCNLVVMVAGIAMMGVAIWFVSDPNATKILHVTATPSSTTTVMAGAAGGIIIFSGVLLFFVGLLGFCGAVRHKTGCLNCFSAILILLIVLQIIAAIMAGVFHSQISYALGNSMQETMKMYNNSADTSYMTEAWNFVQCQFECCGVHNYTNWWNVTWSSNATVEPVPKTCCKLKAHDYRQPNPTNATLCFADARKPYDQTSESDYLYVKGCEQKLNDWLKNQMGPLIGIAVAVVVIEFLGVVLSCVLTARIKSGYEYV